MELIFNEDFRTICNEIPGTWMVEYNSDLTFPAMDMKKENAFSLHSAGNKYVPITPDFTDFAMEAEFSVNFAMSQSFIILLSYRYNIEDHTGECFRITRRKNSSSVIFEVGTTCCNLFTPRSGREIPMDGEIFLNPFSLKLEVTGNELKGDFAGEKFTLEAGEAKKGKLALSREHFTDVLSVHAFKIWSNDVEKVPAKTFTIPLPAQHTLYPIYCDCTLRDYGNCVDAELTFRGGIRDTPPGEGNYHGMRADIMEDCFLKVLTSSETSTYIIHKGEIILVHDQLAPLYMWTLLHKKPDWPMTRKVRFIKPNGKFDLAVGYESYYYFCMKEMCQKPSETVFDLEGKVLSSGEGITCGRTDIEFLSQKEKEFAARLPKDDPRYDKALAFLANNHYFMEGETPRFQIRFTSSTLLPEAFTVELEGAFFRKIEKLKYKKSVSKVKIGVREYSSILLTVTPPKKALAPGVYHLRVTGNDMVADPLMKYCTFEVLSQDPKAPAPPLLSGMPYMYNARTERRGLETDSFDVWYGKSVNPPHYIACAIFQPPAARKHKVMPTVNAYGRENFLWLGSRNCDDFSIEANKDLIAQADYLNVAEEKERSSLLWVYSYSKWRLEKFIEYARSLNDPEFDMELLEKKLEESRKATGGADFFSGGTGVMIDQQSYLTMARKYWYGWVRFINDEFAKKEGELLKKLRKINPRIKYSEYGPFHVYAAKLKGPEAVEFIMTGSSSKETMGFWQFEDYPYACSYDIEIGAYCMTGCMMKLPGQMMCPEIYTGGGLAGCPDGAVFYAHPPFGFRPYKNYHPKRMIRQVYEYALGSGHLMEDGFHFWDNPGFQACGFTQVWFEALLTGWRQVHEYPPASPFASAVYIYSEESCKAAKTIVRSATKKNPLEKAGIVDVTRSATEDVPYAYLAARRDGQLAGFQMLLENIGKLTAKDCKLLVLPPLKGVSQKYLDAIRALHRKGVNLLAFEDVTGLEDLFGVENTGTFTEVGFVQGCGRYDNGIKETSFEPLCGGTYKNKNAKVLVKGAIPVLLCKDNGKAKAAFCNIPPHMVRLDELHERMTYGKESISKVMNFAIAKIQRELTAECEAHTSCGRMIAYHAKNGTDAVIILNHDEEKAITPILTVTKNAGRKKFISCNAPCNMLKDTAKEFQIQARIEPGECAVFLFKR